VYVKPVGLTAIVKATFGLLGTVNVPGSSLAALLRKLADDALAPVPPVPATVCRPFV
jgi:hypothetical protein